MRSGTSERLELEYARHIPTCTALAFVITCDLDLAVRIATRAFSKAAGRLQDLRGADAFEVAVTATCVRSALHARAHGQRDGEGEPLWKAFEALKPRQRAALALAHIDDFDDYRAADVLSCSVTAVGALVESALRELRAAAPSTDVEAEIALLIERRAAQVPQRPRLTPRMVRSIGLSRRLLVASLTVAVLVGLAGVGAGMRQLSSGSRLSTLFDVQDATVDGEGSTSVLKGTCPLSSSLQPIVRERGTARVASELAVRLNAALIDGREGVVAQLALDDETARGPWASTQTARGVRPSFSGRASNSDLVRANCGRAVAQRTWKVVLYDATGITARGLATFYLGMTGDGWRAWGSYEPGP